MATWGDFLQDVPVKHLNPGGMVVAVDDAITLWEERRALREEVAQLKAALAAEREGCAQEVEEFAAACAAEAEDAEVAVALLNACAKMIRERGQDEIMHVEPVDDPEAP